MYFRTEANGRKQTVSLRNPRAQTVPVGDLLDALCVNPRFHLVFKIHSAEQKPSWVAFRLESGGLHMKTTAMSSSSENWAQQSAHWETHNGHKTSKGWNFLNCAEPVHSEYLKLPHCSAHLPYTSCACSRSRVQTNDSGSFASKKKIFF